MLKYNTPDFNRWLCAKLKSTEIKHTFLVSEENYDPINPLDGWTPPDQPVLRDTVSVSFGDGVVANYTYTKNEGTNVKEWVLNFIKIDVEERICLNKETFTPADINNPLTSEVEAWAIANLTTTQRENGTQVVYFVDDYEPYQNNINLYFADNAEDSSITFLVLSGIPIFPRGHNGEIIKIKENGVFVYNETLLKNLIESWLTSNGYEGTLEPPDLENNTLTISHIRGGFIEVDYGYNEDGDNYVDHHESQAVPLIPGNGGTCDEPDFIWTLNEGEITLSNKRVFNTKTVYVDAESGSDVTGRRGYREFPFKTLNAALAVLQAGDTLHVFPGNYFNSVDVSVPFNIYCETGVNWETRLKLVNTNLYNGQLKDFKFKFDNFYSLNTTSGISLFSTTVINNIDIEANKLEYVNIALTGISSLKAKHVKNCLISSVKRSEINTICDIKIDKYENDNYLKQSLIGSTHYFPNSITNIELNNVKLLNNTHGDGGIINLGWGDDIGQNKNITAKINNCRYTPSSIYEVPPNPWYTATLIGLNNFYPHSWMEGVNFTGNQVFWVRNGAVNGTNVNYELKNYRGTGHGFNMYGWDFNTPSTSPTVQRVVNVKIQGYWEKGIPVSLRWFGSLGGTDCPQNTIVNIEMDVVCDTSMGVAFWCTGGIHESNRFNISGKIVTKSPGIPCITISGIAESAGGNIQTNNTITLKDLLLINDGTIQPIMVNPLYNPQVQEVNIMNVKSNSLIVDANITEIGESITRNIKYK